MRFTLPATLLSLAFFATPLARAQDKQSPMPDMSGMNHPSSQMSRPPGTPATPMDMMKPPTTLIEAELAHTNSGTSIEPASTPVAMIMRNYRGWMLMLHGTAFVADTQLWTNNGGAENCAVASFKARPVLNDNL